MAQGILVRPTIVAGEGDGSMSTHPTKEDTTDTLEPRFRRLEASWLAAVGFSSSSTVLRGHPAFQEIISMGEAVVPLMLRDLEERPRLWVWALPRIAGADPVPAGDRGNIVKMSEAWLRWGREHGYQ